MMWLTFFVQDLNSDQPWRKQMTLASKMGRTFLFYSSIKILFFDNETEFLVYECIKYKVPPLEYLQLHKGH